MHKTGSHFQFSKFYFKTLFWFVLGAFLAAGGVKVLLIPNQLIDGGVVGLAIMAAHLFGEPLLPIFLILFNLPFVILAYKQIGKHFVIQMFTAVLLFAFFLLLFYWVPLIFKLEPLRFEGDAIEVIALAGFVIGVGVGLIIRHGGSTDGTEILGILVNRKQGFTVGQVILFANVFIFLAAGFVYWNWHTALLSLLTYVVATKVMDMVIVGFEDTKSVTIITAKSEILTQRLMDDLGIGLTVLYGRGGYSKEKCEILYVVVERLQLAELKEIIHQEDPQAFVAVENLHEVINGRKNSHGLPLLP